MACLLGIDQTGDVTKKVQTRFKPRPQRYFFKEWRKHRGYTQEELAEMIGLTAPSISQLETGKQGFTDSTLEAIAEALNCGPGDLLMRNPLCRRAVVDLGSHTAGRAEAGFEGSFDFCKGRDEQLRGQI